MTKLKHLYLIELEKSLQENTCTATCPNKELLKKMSGKKLAIYFYVSNDDQECSLISDGFAEFFDSLKNHNVEIIGVSRYNINSHHEFKEQHNLPFELISDCNNVISKIFKVGQEGAGVSSIKRKTFIFSAEGMLYNEWRNTSADGHAKNVLYMAKSIGGMF
jgi:peroxiredoxin Q/BCP